MQYPLLTALVLMSGCATQSGVIPNGPDTYSILVSGGSGFVSSGSLAIRAYQQAANYCSAKGMVMEVIDDKQQRAGVLGKFPEAQLRFKCVAAK
jgi:hypothetical protein